MKIPLIEIAVVKILGMRLHDVVLFDGGTAIKLVKNCSKREAEKQAREFRKSYLSRSGPRRISILEQIRG